MQAQAEGNIAKVRITVDDQSLRELIAGYVFASDEIFTTEITYFLKFLYRFDFLLMDLKDNPKAVIEDLITKNCHIKFQYSGSQFMDEMKEVTLQLFQLALSIDAF